MLPVIALVGRPNVGKSTLFNQLTRTRDAIVADFAGLTRDRLYGEAKFDDKPYIVIDTAGLSVEEHGVEGLMAKQAKQAIREADALFFLVDARAGLTEEDKRIAQELRLFEKKVYIVANKTDGLDDSVVTAEFHELGLGEPIAIAASHGRGVHSLIAQAFDKQFFNWQYEALLADEKENGIKLAIIGRPNVGKSTLVNRLLGEERVVAENLPGTTRDSISVQLEREGQVYTLIDTAGIRRRARIDEAVEKFSVIKALQSLEQANVCLILFDAQEGVTDQDLHIIRFAIDAGKALVIGINKWDGLEVEQKEKIKETILRRLNFVDFAETLFISALHGSNVGHLLPAVNRAFKSAIKRISTSELNKAFSYVLEKHPPSMIRGRRIKLRYAHMGGHNPPLIIIHGNQTESINNDYKRYLVNAFRKYFKLYGTPILIQFKSSDNPYKGIRNKLTPRQLRKKKRLKQYHKKK